MTHRYIHRAERGMTLIETLITMLVITGGLLTTLSVFTSMGNATYKAQRKAVLISMAQREMERLRVLPYDKIGLSAPIAADASTKAPLPPSVAAEVSVSGGVISPGATPFEVQGVTGTIYRYVTYRAQSCPLVNASVATQIATSIGQAQADVAAAVGNLCSGTSQTKRITIVVRSNDVVKYGAPVRLSTVATDPSASVLAASGYDGLRVNAQPVVNTATSSNPTPESAYADVTSQALYLTDTRCTSSSRQAPGSGHSSHDTSQTFPVGTNRCATTATAADLMPLTPPSGLLTAPLPDLSTEVSRPAVGGLVLARDDHAGSCTAQVNYAAAEADRRRRSIHTWASKSPGGNYETAVTAGRATLNFWTQTASAQTLPGRMCVTVWRAGTGQILGSADYQLPAWPAEPTQLAIAFDLAHAVIPSGERLMMTLRTPQDSGADLLLLYDHAGYPSSLSIPTRVGSALS